MMTKTESKTKPKETNFHPSVREGAKNALIACLEVRFSNRTERLELCTRMGIQEDRMSKYMLRKMLPRVEAGQRFAKRLNVSFVRMFGVTVKEAKEGV